jgi:hypothetical protein
MKLRGPRKRHPRYRYRTKRDDVPGFYPQGRILIPAYEFHQQKRIVVLTTSKEKDQRLEQALTQEDHWWPLDPAFKMHFFTFMKQEEPNHVFLEEIYTGDISYEIAHQVTEFLFKP